MTFCCELLDALENTMTTLHKLSGADVAFLFMGRPETDGTNNLKLNVRYKLGGFQKVIWSILGWTGVPGTLGSTFALTSSFSLLENMS